MEGDRRVGTDRRVARACPRSGRAPSAYRPPGPERPPRGLAGQAPPPSGSARGARPGRPVPSSASTTSAAFSMPLRSMATSRAVPAWMRSTEGIAVEAVPVAPRVRRARTLVGRDQHDRRPVAALRQPARGHEAVAAVVAGSGEDQHDAGRAAARRWSSAREPRHRPRSRRLPSVGCRRRRAAAP